MLHVKFDICFVFFTRCRATDQEPGFWTELSFQTYRLPTSGFLTGCRNDVIWGDFAPNQNFQRPSDNRHVSKRLINIVVTCKILSIIKWTCCYGLVYWNGIALYYLRLMHLIKISNIYNVWCKSDSSLWFLASQLVTAKRQRDVLCNK